MRSPDPNKVGPTPRRARSADNLSDLLDSTDFTAVLVKDDRGGLEDKEASLLRNGVISIGVFESHVDAYKPIDRISRALSASLLFLLYGAAGLFAIFVEQHIAQKYDTEDPVDGLYKNGLDTLVSVFLAGLIVLSDDKITSSIARGLGCCFSPCSKSARSVKPMHRAREQVRIFTLARDTADNYQDGQAVNYVLSRRVTGRDTEKDARLLAAVRSKRSVQEGQTKLADAVVVGFADYFSQAVATLLILGFGNPDEDKVVKWNEVDALLTAAIFGVTMSLLHHFNFSKPFANLYGWTVGKCTKAESRVRRKLSRRGGRAKDPAVDAEVEMMEKGRPRRPEGMTPLESKAYCDARGIPPYPGTDGAPLDQPDDDGMEYIRYETDTEEGEPHHANPLASPTGDRYPGMM
ncbi:MAG: hypothetical protein P1U34_05655 [Coxiellaceae bacterium]|nr:hypothetical protein [Coxiellaceae bacterium]